MTSEDSAARPPDATARTAGRLLLATAILTVVAVIGRGAADADQDTFEHSMTYIAVNSGLYGLGGVTRAVRSVWPVHSGVRGLRCRTCRLRPEVSSTSILATPEQWLKPVADIRWLTGKIGFAAAGLALIVAARYQWMVGGNLRKIAPLSAIIGLAMQFIWIDSATIMHPIIGTAFFLWLMAIGFMLASGRVERHFMAMTSEA